MIYNGKRFASALQLEQAKFWLWVTANKKHYNITKPASNPDLEKRVAFGKSYMLLQKNQGEPGAVTTYRTQVPVRFGKGKIVLVKYDVFPLW
jgi:hypothetical protein